MTDNDTREKLEATALEICRKAALYADTDIVWIDYGDECNGTASTLYDEIIALLDRQEGITRQQRITDGDWGETTFFGMGFKECGEKLRRAKYELLPEWCEPPKEAVCRKCGYVATAGEAMVCDSCPRCGYSGKLLGSKVDIAILDELRTCRIIATATDCLCEPEKTSKGYTLSCGHVFEVMGLDKPVCCPVCGASIR